MEEQSEQVKKDTNQNASLKEKRRFLIRTMGKDIKKILSVSAEEAPGVGPEMVPEEVSITPRKKMREGPVLKLLIIGIPIIILLGAVVFVYFIFFQKPPEPPLSDIVHFECQNEKCIQIEGEGENTCTQDEDCKLQPPIIVPDSLLRVEATQGIALSRLDKNEFFEGLNEITAISWPEGSLIRILPALGPKENPREFLNLSQLMELLKLSPLQDVTSNLEENYTLFLYSAGDIERIRCNEDNIENPQCWGPRVGITIKVKDIEALKSGLGKWESTMVQDIKSLILFPTSKEETPNFQDFIYKDQLIRYKNLDISTVTINYTIVGELLVIGTSKHCVFAAIDAIGQ